MTWPTVRAGVGGLGGYRGRTVDMQCFRVDLSVNPDYCVVDVLL